MSTNNMDSWTVRQLLEAAKRGDQDALFALAMLTHDAISEVTRLHQRIGQLTREVDELALENEELKFDRDQQAILSALDVRQGRVPN